MSRCPMPGPNGLDCEDDAGHAFEHEATTYVCGVPVRVTWDYVGPAEYQLPRALARMLDAMGETLSALGWEWWKQTIGGRS